MKILFLAPQAFFEERGTPIAVKLAASTISKRGDDSLDLLTFHEGQDISMPDVNHHRTWMPLPVTNIGPGISLKKIVCDFFFLLSVFSLLFKARNNQYQLIHAVEESVFIAWLVKLILKIPYIYDMDSSMSLQIVDKWPVIKPLQSLFSFFERTAVKGSIAVVPVCDSLAIIADKHGSKDTHILRDISLLNMNEDEEKVASPLRDELQLNESDVLFLYIGNLEKYQGIDLLVESLKTASEEVQNAKIVVIGGTQEHIDSYKQEAASLNLNERIFFIGAKPVSLLNDYLVQADVLLSPRTQGNNTPMKIYSYLHSGVPTLATDLPTHTQVLTREVSLLKQPSSNDFAMGIIELTKAPELRKKLGDAGKKLAEQKYTIEVFEKRVHELYDRISRKIA